MLKNALPAGSETSEQFCVTGAWGCAEREAWAGELKLLKEALIDRVS